MRKPFFSIIIPTYNRINYLKRAVHCILLQDFKDFEIIIADNNSTDNTQHLIKNFKRKEIIYFKNNRNIGLIPNLKKGMKIARGKYVILHGDDDFIIYQDCLKQAYNLIKKRNYGFIRLNTLHFSYKKNRIFDYKKILKDLAIEPKQKSEDIVRFLTKAEFSTISGVIYRNYKDAYKEVFFSESGPWFRIVFKNVYKYGGYLLAKHNFILTWARSSDSLYMLQKGKLKFENYYQEVSKVVHRKYYNDFLKDELKMGVILMSSAKVNTSLQNFFNLSKRIIYLSPDYKYSFRFWVYFFSALLAPKFILRLIRAYNEAGFRSYKIPNYKKIMKNIQFLNQYSKYTEDF